jgi:hypothetical protein
MNGKLYDILIWQILLTELNDHFNLLPSSKVGTNKQPTLLKEELFHKNKIKISLIITPNKSNISLTTGITSTSYTS